MGQRLIISEEERSLIGKMHGLRNEPILSEQFNSSAVYKVLDHIVNSGRMERKEEGDKLSFFGAGGYGNELYNTLKSEAQKSKEDFLGLINMDMSEDFKKFKTVEITLRSGSNHNREGKIILTRKNLTDDFSMTMDDDFDN
jgi:hypothetical protein